MAEKTFHSITLPGQDTSRVPLTATEFSTSVAYKVKDYCTYQGKLYRCTTAHAVGAWNAAHFTETDVDAEFDRKLDIPASQASAPANPRVGDLWIDNDENSPIYNVDASPTLNSTNAVQSGGTKVALNSLDSRKMEHGVITGDFSASVDYRVGDLVFNSVTDNGITRRTLYRCTTDHNSTAWNPAHFTATTLEVELQKIRESEADTDMIGDLFGAKSIYAVGDYCIYNDNLYRCIIAVDNSSTSTPAFNPNDWTQVKLANDVSDLKSTLNEIIYDDYTENSLDILARTADRAIANNGAIAYSPGNTVIQYSVSPGDLIIATVPERQSETYKVVYGFYNGLIDITTLVGTPSVDELNNTVIVIPVGVNNFVISQVSSASADNVKLLSSKVETVDNKIDDLSLKLISTEPIYTKTDGTNIDGSVIKTNYYGVEATSTRLEFKPLNSYNGFLAPVNKDTYFYFDDASSVFRFNTIENGTLTESGGVYIVTGTNSIEYNSGNLPTENNKVLVHAGGYIVVTARQSQVLSVNMSNAQFSTDILLNNRQIDQAKASVIAELGQNVKSLSCKYDTNNLYIYIPTGSGYIRYDFMHNIIQSRNADVWRVDAAYSVDENYDILAELTTYGEWECALHLQDRDDFSGGSAHGDEIVQEITFIVDGEAIPVADLSNGMVFSELRIVELSKMYDPADHTTQICVHGSEHIFNRDGLIINQNIIWSGNFPATTCYLAMFPTAKHGDDKIYMDNNYALESLPVSNYRNVYNGAKSITVFSESAKYTGVFEIPKYVDGPGGNVLWILDNGGGNYHKMYFVVTTGENVTSGTIWKTQTKYKLDIGG